MGYSHGRIPALLFATGLIAHTGITWHTVLLLLGHSKLILCFSDRKNPDDDPAGWHGKEKNKHMNIIKSMKPH